MCKKLMNYVQTTSNVFVSSNVYYNFIIVENVGTKISKNYGEIGALANNHWVFFFKFADQKIFPFKNFEQCVMPCWISNVLLQD